MAETFHDVMKRLAVKEVERRYDPALRNAAFKTCRALGEVSDLRVSSWEYSHDQLFRPLAIQEGSRKAV